MIESSELVDSGGLTKPPRDLSELIKIADTVLECKVKKSKDIFSEIDCEIDCEHDKKVSHRVKTLKQACAIYFSMQIKYLIEWRMTKIMHCVFIEVRK